MTPLAQRLVRLPVAPGPGWAGDASQREYARGKQDAEAAGLERMEAALDNERHRLAGEIAAERSAWTAEEGERLRHAIGAAIAGIEQRLDGVIARILQPFLYDRLRDKALASFARTTQSLMRDGDAIHLTIRGPEDLLRRAFGAAEPTACTVRIEEGSCDVSATFGETRIETLIGGWIEHLREGGG
jgi:hypothetical protein